MSEDERRRLLRDYGATPEEIEFLLEERVELNALTSEQLVALVELKLTAYGLKKVVPDEELLAETYRAFHRSDELREEFEDLMATMEESTIKVPKNLEQKCARSSPSTPISVGTTRSGPCSTPTRLITCAPISRRPSASPATSVTTMTVKKTNPDPLALF